ncbi:MAG: RAD55 family ATPase [Candidatus Thermoplasmatota archaeon]|nr:RAD55 family ATPase [Candidatus Thermoplasmatota archaeon]
MMKRAVDDEKLTFGIREIDRIFGGSLPKGFSFLVIGQPGSGKEVLLKQFAGTKGESENCVYFTATEGEDEIYGFIEQHGWKGDIKIVDLGRIYYEKILSQTLRIAKERRDLSVEKIAEAASVSSETQYSEEEINFVNLVWGEFTEMPKPMRAVFDCLEFIADYHSQQEAINLVQAIKTYAQNIGGLVLFSLTKDLYPSMQLRLESIVDCVIELDTNRRVDEVERLVIIKKIKNSPHKISINRYRIGDEGFQYDTMKRVV